MSIYNSSDNKKHSNKGGWYCLHPQQSIAEPVNASTLVSSATLSLDNRGLAYADGFFTTMAIYNGEILWADYHWQRLDSHARALQFEIPKPSLLLDLKSHAEQLQQGMMKVIVTRATQSLRGYGFNADTSGNACEIWLKIMPIAHQTAISQTASPHASLLLADGRFISMQTPIKASCLTSQLACLPPTLAGLKSLNRLDNVLASGELQALKANSANLPADTGVIGEGLVRDMSGSWVEGTMSNVFYQLSASAADSSDDQNNSVDSNINYLTNGQWYTPSMTQSGVAGVMRQVIIDSLANTKNPVIHKPLADEDLPKISQMFFCNAVRGVMPVTALTLLSGEMVELSL